MDLPLHDIRVLDLTQVMAGPFCTMLLADLGADVIKVEPPGKGDLSRSMGGARLRGRGADHAPFLALNRNKRSIVLDLKSAAARSTFLRLAKSADVIVESFRPGVVRRLGIDYASVTKVQPGIVYASISGFGQTGPYADRPGFDLIAQGMAGIMSVTGEPDGEPVKSGVPIADLAAGLYAALGIQAALLARQENGMGQFIETSLFEAALGLSVWEATEFFATGKPPQALGSAHRLNAPYQAFRTADGHINVAALTPGQWRDLCSCLERDDLASDPRFADNAARMSNRSALVSELESSFVRLPTGEWVERLSAANVPAGPIHDYAEVFDDAHTRERHMIEEIDHPVEGRVRTLGFPLKMHGSPLSVRRPPPLLGEHTAEILAEMEKSTGKRES
jgi:formyl-CoA transferase